MITDFRNRLTYFGTLDDVVYRYPWPTSIDKLSIQQHLITAAIYDKKILINDGYLIANPQLLGELQDIDRSLVGNLMMTGAARLFARGGKTNLAAGIENGAGKIKTHTRIVQDAGRWRLMRDDLEFLSSEVEKYTVPWPRDKNMGQIFYSLMTRVRGLDSSTRSHLLTPDQFRDFDAIFDRFVAAIARPSFDAARTVWEDQCWIYYGGDTVSPDDVSEIETVQGRQRMFAAYDRVRPMMNLANEMYHLAYSIGAHHTLQSENANDDIDTSTIGMASSILTAFPDLVAAEQPAKDAPDIKTLNALNQLLIAIPPDLHFKDDFYFVSRLKTNGDCRRARADYLANLKKFVEGNSKYAVAEQSRNAYVETLKRQMRAGIKANRLEAAFGASFDLLMMPVELAVGSLSAGLKIAAGFGASVALPIGVDHFKTMLVERLLELRVSAALASPGISAVQDAGAVPLARQLGLYLGPLRPEGSEALLKDIQSHPSIAPEPTPPRA